MPQTQNRNGRAFEYAIAYTLYEFLKDNTVVFLQTDEHFYKTKSDFDSLHSTKQNKLLNAGLQFANFIVDLEPSLLYPGNHDRLIIFIQSDRAGEYGDVRDIVCIRSLSGWEIGFSAKHHHHAVKHSRLSLTIDFGLKWMGEKCSEEYYSAITPIFETLREMGEIGLKFKDIPNKEETIYLPVLKAFQKELWSLYQKNNNIVSSLLKYLLGEKDFYKIIYEGNSIVIQGINIYGTLNRPVNNIQAKYKVPVLKLPTRIIDLDFKKHTKTTLILIMDNGWTISFRIHNASSKVEPSLKFDIQLIGHPSNLFTHTIFL